MSARRPWALPLRPLYWAGLRAKDALRAIGLVRTCRLGWPVLSVGSISAGGAGKTPVVIALAKLLRADGHTVDVLSRGYGRQSDEVARVDLTASDAAIHFGDEPTLIAASGVPVWVGADRYAAGAAAEQTSAPASGIHLLDDGFQHRRLVRALDIVLLTAEDLADFLLPAGNLREPLSALRRAHVVLLREEERDSVEPLLRSFLHPDLPVFLIRRTLHVPTVPATPALAFSGIARPNNFLHMLKSCGLRVIDSLAYPDHHRYTARDMDSLAQRLRSSGAQAFITTEKDAVKITPELRAILEAAAPLHIAQLQVEFAEPASLLAELEARCR